MPPGRSDMPAAASQDTVSAEQRRVASALKALGERIVPLEQAANEQRIRHDVVVAKLDGLHVQVGKLGDKADLVNDRCDDLNTRLCIIERAWNEQMRPGLERLRNLELKVAGAAVLGGTVGAVASELVRALVH